MATNGVDARPTENPMNDRDFVAYLYEQFNQRGNCVQQLTLPMDHPAFARYTDNDFKYMLTTYG